MKHKQPGLDVDFIGGGRPLTKDDEIAISNFIRAYQLKHKRKPSASKRTFKASKKKAGTKSVKLTSNRKQLERITSKK